MFGFFEKCFPTDFSPFECRPSKKDPKQRKTKSKMAADVSLPFWREMHPIIRTHALCGNWPKWTLTKCRVKVGEFGWLITGSPLRFRPAAAAVVGNDPKEREAPRTSTERGEKNSTVNPEEERAKHCHSFRPALYGDRESLARFGAEKDEGKRDAEKRRRKRRSVVPRCTC